MKKFFSYLIVEPAHHFFFNSVASSKSKIFHYFIFYFTERINCEHLEEKHKKKTFTKKKLDSLKTNKKS